MKRGTGNPWRRLGLPARVGRLVVAVYGIAAVLVTASSVWGRQGGDTALRADQLVVVACVAFAAGMCRLRRLASRSDAADTAGWRS